MGVTPVENLDDFMASLTKAGSSLVVVDFSAQWCGPCRMIGPKFEKMSEEFENIKFLKVDVDDGPDIAEKYGISCMPTFLFFKNGEKVAEFSGANEQKLRQVIVDNQ